MSAPPVQGPGSGQATAEARVLIERFQTNAFEPIKHHADKDLLFRLVDRYLRERERLALERAAKVAEGVEGPYQIGEGTPCNCGDDIAAQIRALIPGVSGDSGRGEA